MYQTQESNVKSMYNHKDRTEKYIPNQSLQESCAKEILALGVLAGKTLENRLIVLTSSSQLRRPRTSHQVPDTRNSLAIVRTVGNNHIVALKVLDHAINESVDGVLTTTRTPVLVIDAGKLADPDGLAELADVVFDDLDAFGYSGLVDVNAGDVPSDALSSEVGEPRLIELSAHWWRAQCDTAVAKRLDKLIPFLHTHAHVCDVAGRRAIAVGLVEAKEYVRVCFAACHVFGKVSEAPFVDGAVGVVG